MITQHQALVGDARELAEVDDRSVHLIVTSPPYPMIEMWDGVFSEVAPPVGQALASGDCDGAFDRMHVELDKAWQSCHRALVPGGLACVNIGDATRTFNGEFRLFSNHARIIQGMRAAGFSVLPDIVWRKPTNAPNKFMGSGMLPAGAYVTYEHEYILVFRKGGKRNFAGDSARAQRRKSAYFWEERNLWFSDVWTGLVGVRQGLADAESRGRSAAFPFELPYRLVQMFSVYGDTVLDPFAGIGTTLVAAIASARNSIGVDRDRAIVDKIAGCVVNAARVADERLAARISAHTEFVTDRVASGKRLLHTNAHYGFEVVTRQEVDLVLLRPASVSSLTTHRWTAQHEPMELQRPPRPTVAAGLRSRVPAPSG